MITMAIASAIDVSVSADAFRSGNLFMKPIKLII
jgi:hypothetical protein